MSPECAICYVSDLNFLLPSLVSAGRVRKFVPQHKADIFIFTVDVDTHVVAEAHQFATRQGISIIKIGDHVFSKLDKNRLAMTQTPLGTFGRFFMDELLPPSCRRIVYLDGDVLAVQDPTPLIEAIVPEGRFAAAEDTIFFRQKLGLGWTAKDIRSYFTQLGLHPKNGYFNAGVFAASRNTWRGIAREAYNYFMENTDKCRHFDQSALNAIMGDRRLRLSSKWNFQKQLKIWGADRYVSPIIHHFNRYPKPWMGVIDPWPTFFAEYQNAIATFAPLNLPHKILPQSEIDMHNQITRRSYSYLSNPAASWAAMNIMKFKSAEIQSWM